MSRQLCPDLQENSVSVRVMPQVDATYMQHRNQRVRHPNPARIELRAIGFDRVTVVPADVRDQISVAAAIAGAEAVVNTVSAYVEKSGVTFEAVHVRGAETVAREAIATGTAPDRQWQYPITASLCGRRGGGCRRHTHRPWNRRSNLRTCRSQCVYAARTGQHDACGGAQTRKCSSTFDASRTIQTISAIRWTSG